MTSKRTQDTPTQASSNRDVRSEIEQIKKRLAFGLENNHLIDRVDIEVAEILDMVETLLDRVRIEARVEAIASYKKVNDKLENEIRIDELNKMQVRAMDDPDDDTNLFWYRTYTMPEFEARLAQLRATNEERGK